MRYSKSMLSNLIGQAYIIPIIAFLAFVGLSLLSCDNHEAVDTNMHIGYVLCEDNSCMDTATYFHQTSKKGVGVVFFEKNDTVPALAVMLHEYTGAYSDTVPITFGTSTNIKGINGRSNTVAMSSSSNGKGSSPIAHLLETVGTGQAMKSVATRTIRLGFVRHRMAVYWNRQKSRRTKCVPSYKLITLSRGVPNSIH